MPTITQKNPDKVVDLVFESILKNRLKPGIKLSEISLQEEFGWSRAEVRQGFDKLVDSGVLIHKKNQSVRVAKPTEIDTRQIYEARKAIENSVIMILVQKHQNNELDLRGIDSLVKKEKSLHQDTDNAKLARLSCDFHLSLAELCDNKFIVESLKPLIPLSALAASIYADNESNFCSFTEHFELIEAIKSNDLLKASKAINSHLDRCVESLDFNLKATKNHNNSHLFN